MDYCDCKMYKKNCFRLPFIVWSGICLKLPIKGILKKHYGTKFVLCNTYMIYHLNLLQGIVIRRINICLILLSFYDIILNMFDSCFYLLMDKDTKYFVSMTKDKRLYYGLTLKND